MIKDHYVPRRNQPGQRLLGAQRSQLPPAVHLAHRPAAASRRSAGSEVHPARQRAAGWARCLRDPCPGCVTILRPGRLPRLIGGPVRKQDTKGLMITELKITTPPGTLPARSAGQPYGRRTRRAAACASRSRGWPAWRRSRAAAARVSGVRPAPPGDGFGAARGGTGGLRFQHSDRAGFPA
jgi:hypothetical protein